VVEKGGASVHPCKAVHPSVEKGGHRLETNALNGASAFKRGLKIHLQNGLLKSRRRMFPVFRPYRRENLFNPCVTPNHRMPEMPDIDERLEIPKE